MSQTPTAPFGTLPDTEPVPTSRPVAPLPAPPPLRRRLRLPVLTAAAAVAVRVLGAHQGPLLADGLRAAAVALAAAALFVGLAVVTIRRLAHELDAAAGERLGPARASVVGVVAAVLGYGCTGLLTLTMLDVPVQQLLLGGVVTGVVLGIAAQQTLANLLAGGVLMMSRPFTVGEQVTVHSGAMGGPFTGVVLGAGLTYVRVRTEEGVLQLPNAALVNAAIVASPSP
ncbi:mechanosensitive ion channel family protein [Rhodococcus antarcticus]|uniref:Mechanosensitive ion channel family protein n=1 Tax=Rhodococcus antarcticus TaxID=2987751 RepID=A0ABY6P0W8_9NOCA|nr:mechanosensitive ion channel family protein [Rhodococcus antarcticus]UZJ24853.1 mechanosensitive ion channel family protein [Rhodococcus antarcticus]